jgi:hypothetical protein
LRDPKSFHKYLYVHADPVSAVDPTGRDLYGSLAVITIAVGLSLIGYFGYRGYVEHRNGRIGLPVNWPLQLASDPGTGTGYFLSVPYVLALFPDSTLDDTTFTSLQKGCVGLLRVRLGIHGKSGFSEPWTEVPGSRGFTDFAEAEAVYEDQKGAGGSPWLYVVQRNPSWPTPTNLGLGTSEIDLGVGKLPMPGGDFNFASLLHLRDGKKAWEDMPNGLSNNPNLRIHRYPLDPESPSLGLQDPIYNHIGTSPRVFIVSPTRNTGFREE